MSENNKKILSYIEVQQQLPDYAFNRLSAVDKAIFEESITLYPDLEQELEEVRKVFERVEQTDFEEKFARKTRNLSVDVLNKMQKKKSSTGLQSLSKYLVPSLGFILIIILVLNSEYLFKSKTKTEQISTSNESQKIINLKSSELSVILDTLISDDEYIMATNDLINNIAFDPSKSSSIDNYSSNGFFDEIYDVEVLDKILHIVGNEMIKSEMDFYNILFEINNLDFEDIQSIIKEIENVKIPT